jgi:hypothetical protein
VSVEQGYVPGNKNFLLLCAIAHVKVGFVDQIIILQYATLSCYVVAILAEFRNMKSRFKLQFVDCLNKPC